MSMGWMDLMAIGQWRQEVTFYKMAADCLWELLLCR